MNVSGARGILPTLAILAVLVGAVAGGSVLLPHDNEGGSTSAIDVAALLPEGTLFHLSADGLACAAHQHELAVAEIWREEEVQRFLKPLLAFIEGHKARLDGQLEKKLGLRLDDLLALRRGKLTFSITDLDPEKLMNAESGAPGLPDMVMTFEYPEALATVRKLLDVFEKVAFEEDIGVFSDDVVEGIKVKHFAGRLFPFDLWYMVQDRLFMVANSRSTFEGMLKRLKTGDGAGSLAASGAFKSAAASLRRPGTTLFAYAAPARIMGAVNPILEQIPEIRAQLEDYASMEAIGFASSIDGPGVRERFFVKPVKGSSLLDRMPGPDFAVRAHQLVPADTRLFAAGGVSLSKTFAVMQARFAEMGLPGNAMDAAVEAIEDFMDADLVKDVLPNLGPELAVYMAWPGQALMPDMAFMVQVQDRKKLDALLAGIANKTGANLPIHESEYLGTKISHVDVKAMEFASLIDEFPPLKPTWAVVSGYLVIAPWPQVVRNLVKGIAKGEPRLTAHGDFKTLLARLQADVPKGARLQGVGYMDIKSFAGFILDNVAPFAQSLAPADIPIDLAELPTTETITDHLFGGLALTWTSGDAMVSDIYSPTGFVAPLVAIAAAGAATFVIVAQDVAGAPPRQQK